MGAAEDILAYVTISDMAGQCVWTDAVNVVGGNEKSALEYGCGTGLVGLHLINDFKTLVFADSSREMLKQAEQKLGRI